VVTLAGAARGTVLRVGLPDRDVVRIARGSAARVRLDAYPGRVFTGTVTEVAAQATPGTGTFAVEVALPAAQGLQSGLVGQVEITAREGAPVTLVPVEAIVEADGDSGAVFVLDGTRVRRRQVQIGFLDGARVGVSGGLEGAMTVVVEGAAWLADGDSVRVVP
jgi:RND family efflux transporter MFP subunit